MAILCIGITIFRLREQPKAHDATSLTGYPA